MKAQSAEKHTGCLYILLSIFPLSFYKKLMAILHIPQFCPHVHKQVYLIGRHLQQSHAHDNFKSSTSRNSSLLDFREPDKYGTKFP